jgi:hypothetical protein
MSMQSREALMQVAIVNAIVQAIAGAIGGGVVAGTIKEHGVRIAFNMVAGGIGGAVGGFFLNSQIPALVNGGGQPNIDPSAADDLAMRVLAGFIAGGLFALIFNVLNLFKQKHINNTKN